MEQAITIIICAAIGGLFRLYWGGWTGPDNLAKRIIGFLLPLNVAFYCLGVSYLSLAFAGLILFAWLMPFHGFGISMGADPKRPLWACIVVMAAQYSAVTIAFAALSGLWFYSLMGVCVMLGYLVPRRMNWPPHTSYGEVFMGVCLIGGLPASILIMDLLCGKL